MTDTPKKRGNRDRIAGGLQRGREAEQRALELRVNRADRLLAGGDAPEPRVKTKPEDRRPADDYVEKFAVSMPSSEAARVEALLLRAAQAGERINRSHLFRIAIHALNALSDEEFLAAVRSVERLKPGRR